jgi:hypothetical protein
MHSTNKFKLIAVLALALAGMAIAAAGATAHGHGDRAARLDSDKDSASNRCEVQASLDSTKTDTDANGTIDGLEDSDGDGANNAAESRLRTNCGVANTRFRLTHATVVSYSAEDGLALKIGKRGLVTAAVSAKVVCEQDDTSSDSSDDNTATVSRHGEDDGAEHDAGDDNGGDRPAGPSGASGEVGDDNGGDRQGRGGDDRGGDNRGGEGDDTVACTTADLVADADVKSAKIKNGKFTRIHLASADEGDF